VPRLPCSLEGNGLGPEGGTAIAEALKVNDTITTIKYVPHSPFNARLRFVAIATRLRFVAIATRLGVLPTG
jgi:hypothetical protein